MRSLIALAPLALLASPAVAQSSAPAPKDSGAAEVTRALNDPATADKLSRVLQVISKAFLNLPVGEVEAALEGREPTAQERARTVLSEGREKDPNFDKNLQRQLANSKPIIEASMKALAASLPAMMKGLGEASKTLERAVENMPRPNYPKQ
jgi:hypothetical protein